jgi:hypothetical protein
VRTLPEHKFRDNPSGGVAWRLAGSLPEWIAILFDLSKRAPPTAIAAAAALVVGHRWAFYRVIFQDRGGRGLGPATSALFVLAFREVAPAYFLGALAVYGFRWLLRIGIVAFPLGLLYGSGRFPRSGSPQLAP